MSITTKKTVKNKEVKYIKYVETNVFLFVPNLIGYVRIILAIKAVTYLCHGSTNGVYFYVVSAALDAVDGWAARRLDQSSKFGAILDQLTDRCAFLGLLMALIKVAPRWTLFFIFTAVTDVFGHWIFMHSTVLSGATSHKTVSSNPLLQFYYNNKTVLFGLCAANEVFFLSAYCIQFAEGIFGYYLYLFLSTVTLPLVLIKSLISIVHAVEASKTIADMDMKLKQNK